MALLTHFSYFQFSNNRQIKFSSCIVSRRRRKFYFIWSKSPRSTMKYSWPLYTERDMRKETGQEVTFLPVFQKPAGWQLVTEDPLVSNSEDLTAVKHVETFYHRKCQRALQGAVTIIRNNGQISVSSLSSTKVFFFNIQSVLSHQRREKVAVSGGYVTVLLLTLYILCLRHLHLVRTEFRGWICYHGQKTKTGQWLYATSALPSCLMNCNTRWAENAFLAPES